MKNEKEMFIVNAMGAWKLQVDKLDEILGKLSQEQLMGEISPGKNRGIYLLGHLVSVVDAMLPLLRFEERLLYPELKSIFMDAPDKTVSDLPSVEQLKKQWKTVNEKLLSHFNSLSTSEWFTRHASVSEEDFIKESHRNRLSILLSRPSHLSYHRGQLVMLIEKG